jgi:hypothetical protein
MGVIMAGHACGPQTLVAVAQGDIDVPKALPARAVSA